MTSSPNQRTIHHTRGVLDTRDETGATTHKRLGIIGFGGRLWHMVTEVQRFRRDLDVVAAIDPAEEELRIAGNELLEPVDRFMVEAPERCLGEVMGAIETWRGVAGRTTRFPSRVSLSTRSWSR